MKPSYKVLNIYIYFDDSVPFKEARPVEGDKDGAAMSRDTWKYITGGRKSMLAERIKE